MGRIFFQERGQGRPVILLHGFPMHQEVWNDFAPRLADSCRVITPDLPGFGKTPILPYAFSIADVALEVLNFCAEKEIHNSVVIGHSLGGYVALAMVEKNPVRFAGLGLFHSTAYADSEEKKFSRTKVVEFVNQHGAEPFTSNFIPPLFARHDHPAIPQVRKLSIQATADAVKGYTIAMRDRPEQLKTLKNFKNPTLFIAGEKDGGIPVQTVLAQSKLCQHPENHLLQDVGHMGMFEKPEQTAAIIRDFLGKISHFKD
jgi:pimeloyl-ACP methyl ester carboxylesterase